MIPKFVNPSVMKKDFSRVPKINIPRSNFNRSHKLTTTFDGGYLIPILVDEVVPGDSFNLKTHSICRMITPTFPVMDRIHLSFFYFFVPTRLVWEHFKEFLGEHDGSGPQDVDYTIPQVSAPVSTGFSNHSLYDYMGVPTLVDGFDCNNLLPRCYNLIWNEWFKEQSVQASVQVDMGDGPDDPSNYVLLKRNKRHDYFTSCLPYAQKSTTPVDLPLGTTAPIEYETGLTTAGRVRKSSDDTLFGNAALSSSAAGNFVCGAVDGYYDPNGTLYADLSAAEAVTINAFREAITLQRFLETDARSGTRYNEIIKGHFGVSNPDIVYRPEYLGGGDSFITVQPVTNNSATTDYVGDLGATAYGQSSGIGFQKSFTEYGFVIGIACAWCDLTYQESLRRMWSYQTKWDLYWPEFAHLGEQEVLCKELCVEGGANDDTVFGYQERYAHMRYFPSLITGKMRSNGPINLDVWHLAQDFAGTCPTLNSDFIEEDPPFDRVVNVPSEPHFKLDCYFEYICTRPLPTYSVPGLGLRF